MAMIDSGAGVTTFSPATVKKLNLRTIREEHPISVRNADGSKNKSGDWIRSVRTHMNTDIWKGNITIAVIDTHEDNILLGSD